MVGSDSTASFQALDTEAAAASSGAPRWLKTDRRISTAARAWEAEGAELAVVRVESFYSRA